ncbi:hypothetical protein RDABS01_000931 [Bienertia sinuspersici]
MIIVTYSIISGPTLGKSCNAIDKEALLDFKSRIEFDGRGRLSTWMPENDCCATWYGVKCDPTNGRVVQLSPFAPRDPWAGDNYATKYDMMNLTGFI